MKNKILIILGPAGAGKTTTSHALVSHIDQCALVEGDGFLKVNPFEYGNQFIEMSIDLSISLMNNFFRYGFSNIIFSSVIGSRETFLKFNEKFKHEVEFFVLNLTPKKEERDNRRIKRQKGIDDKKEHRDWLDENFPVDQSLREKNRGEYQYKELDNTRLTIDKSIEKIKEIYPEFFK